MPSSSAHPHTQAAVIGLAGWSGSGKTSLLTALLPLLRARGLRVSTLKHAHHSFDVDRPGKDSYRHREAGAEEVLVASANRWVLMHEHRGQPEPSSRDLIAKMSPVDLIVIEGFKREAHKKIEIYREDVGKPPLWPEDPNILAVAAPTPLSDCHLPQLPLNEPERIADFLIDYCAAARAEVAWPS